MRLPRLSILNYRPSAVKTPMSQDKIQDFQVNKNLLIIKQRRRNMDGPQIHFFGVLSRDPEECPIGDDTYVRLHVVTVTEFLGARDPETLVFRVHLFGHEGDSAMERCRRGQSVYVYGRYSQTTHKDEHGTVRITPLVLAKEFHVLS